VRLLGGGCVGGGLGEEMQPAVAVNVLVDEGLLDWFVA
jgi:hypothetical protein